MKIAGYVRVSTQDQATKGQSLEVQRELIERYVQLHDLGEVEFYVDGGISGGKPLAKRTAGARLLEAIEAGTIDTVIATKIDRLGRSLLDVMQLVQLLEKKGVNLVLLDLNVDTQSVQGKFMLQILSSFAEMERGLIRERTLQTMQHLKQNHKIYGNVPLSFNRVGKDLVPNMDEMQIVQRIFNMKAEGVSLNGIAKTLNNEGIKGKQGGKFHHTTIKTILNNKDLYAPFIDMREER